MKRNVSGLQLHKLGMVFFLYKGKWFQIDLLIWLCQTNTIIHDNLQFKHFTPCLIASCFSSKSYNLNVVNKPLNISFNLIISSFDKHIGHIVGNFKENNEKTKNWIRLRPERHDRSLSLRRSFPPLDRVR